MLRWCWMLVGLALPAALGADAKVVINEFMAGNDVVLCDEDGNDPDWLELHNAGDRAVDLAGWYLTDETERLTRWRFPSVTLAPGDYLLIYMSGKNRLGASAAERKPTRPAQKGLHTSFRLNYRGEMLLLVGPGGGRRDIVDSRRFGRQDRNSSTGRIPNSADGWGPLAKPTPGRSNASDPPPSGCPPPPRRP